MTVEVICYVFGLTEQSGTFNLLEPEKMAQWMLETALEYGPEIPVAFQLKFATGVDMSVQTFTVAQRGNC